MMNVQLLLLVTLAGPFCAFTHASPTARTTDVVPAVSPEAAKASDENSTLTPWLMSSPSASIPDATTASEVSSTLITSPPASQPTTEVTTVAAPSISSVFWTEAPDATTIASEPPNTDPPVWETAATVTKILKATEEVAVEDDTEGLSSGQVVGIVIGALLALVILIAVVIAVMRRMGKYSP